MDCSIVLPRLTDLLVTIDSGDSLPPKDIDPALRAKLRYQRVLLKLSGEALAAGGVGIDPETLRGTAAEIAEVRKTGVEIGLVVGGGNKIGRAHV